MMVLYYESVLLILLLYYVGMYVVLSKNNETFFCENWITLNLNFTINIF